MNRFDDHASLHIVALTYCADGFFARQIFAVTPKDDPLMLDFSIPSAWRVALALLVPVFALAFALGVLLGMTAPATVDMTDTPSAACVLAEHVPIAPPLGAPLYPYIATEDE